MDILMELLTHQEDKGQMSVQEEFRGVITLCRAKSMLPKPKECEASSMEMKYQHNGAVVIKLLIAHGTFSFSENDGSTKNCVSYFAGELT